MENEPTLSEQIEALPTDDMRGLTPEQDAIYERLHHYGEDACAAGMTLAQAVQSIRDGFSSVEGDRIMREELADPGPLVLP